MSIVLSIHRPENNVTGPSSDSLAQDEHGCGGASESQALTQFVRGLRLDSIPVDVVELARLHLLDSIGIGIASSGFPFAHSVLDSARELGAGRDARVLGFGDPLPAASAALVNGTLIHGLDYDDTHIAAVYHASAPALAAALAAGETSSASGKELLTAYIAGLEVGCRMAAATPGAFHLRGLHPTSMCGAFAAAAAVGRLRRTNAEQMTNAFGVCASMAGGVIELGDGWLKRVHPGWAAHCGVAADALGRSGVKAARTALEGTHGFYAAHVAHVPAGTQSPTHRIGLDWALMGLALKPYPCCHFLHAFVDAALALRAKLNPDDIERIECPLVEKLHPMVGVPHNAKSRPSSVYEALFSVPYVVALTIVKGRVDLAAFHDAPLNDPAVLALAARTRCVDDPDSDFPVHFPGEVRVFLKDGQVLSRREPTSLGTPERRLDRGSVERKFLANATRVVSPDQAKRLVDVVNILEDLDAVRNLVTMCVRT